MTRCSSQEDERKRPTKKLTSALNVHTLDYVGFNLSSFLRLKLTYKYSSMSPEEKWMFTQHHDPTAGTTKVFCSPQKHHAS